MLACFCDSPLGFTQSKKVADNHTAVTPELGVFHALVCGPITTVLISFRGIQANECNGWFPLIGNAPPTVAIAPTGRKRCTVSRHSFKGLARDGAGKILRKE